MADRATLRLKGPYDLDLTLKAIASFSPQPAEDMSTFRSAVSIDGTPAVVEVRQIVKDPPLLEVSGACPGGVERLKEVAEWMLLTDLDLREFYHTLTGHPKFAPIARRLNGLKPMRSASLFEMAVIAITEQQISLTAAYRIRLRVIERFGERIDDLWAFPSAERLARASKEELMAFGLSQRKSEYIKDLASKVAEGSMDLNELKDMSDEDARSSIISLRGFGQWSADYILIRGLGRLDCAPADDLGVRTIVGEYLGGGERMTPAQVRTALEPFVPFRGIATFYLLVHHRLGGRLSD